MKQTDPSLSVAATGRDQSSLVVTDKFKIFSTTPVPCFLVRDNTE